MKILLLEGIHSITQQKFEDAGYTVETRKDSPSDDQLLEVIEGVHILGIRSKTKVSSNVLRKAKNLLSIGCFCIGTDQVELEIAAKEGIPVFNAPFSNTRSVAELTIAEIIMLARKASHKSRLLHEGIWDKSADGCFEVRNKKLGIVGYGNIGPQVGVLAEALGMSVTFYDVVAKLPLGNCKVAATLDDLLKSSDFVTLHVPETTETRGLIGVRELSQMKKGAYLLNLSRGMVVDIDALSHSLTSGHLAGAAVDVFPEEPHSNKEEFHSPLRGLDNVILTPHIGGSTLEAQRNIGQEVFTSLFRFVETGSSAGAVNFPQVDLPVVKDSHRILNIHRNVPGVLSAINSIMAEMGVNIQSQYLATHKDVGYMIMDVSQDASRTLKARIDALETSIRTRLLF